MSRRRSLRYRYATRGFKCGAGSAATFGGYPCSAVAARAETV
ncbi:hypothetical protein CSE45_1093 [Citreicella sp. SE45]|nr:hypothetical protein CSE45_1093 [Citreicella sp. SE45]